MAIDGFFIKNLIKEINNEINKYRLEQINLVTNDIFSFSFYYQKNRKFLNIKLNSPHASIFIDNMEFNKTLTSSFLNNLKKYLEGAILKNINQKDDDRVILFEFERVDFLDGLTSYTLVLELMGRYNNLILLKDNIIIDAFNKNVSTTNRSIVPNIKFEYFPSNKLIFNMEAYNDMENNLDLSKSYIGISPLLSKYLYNNHLNINEINVNPTYNIKTNQFYWFDLFLNDKETKHFNSLSKLLVNVIVNNFKPNNKYLNFINNKISLYNKRLYTLRSQLIINNENLVFVNYGNDIYSSGLNLNSYYSEITNSDNISISLDITKTLNENAQIYFNKYKKAKRAINHLENQIQENENALTLLEQFLYEINLENLNHLEISEMLIPFGFKTRVNKNKRKPKIQPLKIEYNNNTYYVGLNNIQNEYITQTLANKNDYWFHIKDSPGSHVLLKGTLTKEALEIASMLALKYSKMKQQQGLVNYTLVKNLRKIPKVPGYQVLLKQYKTINITVNNELLNSITIANQLKK